MLSIQDGGLHQTDESMAYKDIRLFSGGMDLDSEVRMVKKEDYREAYNFRSGVSDDDNVGSGENLKGNINVYEMDERNVVIGSAKDVERDAIIVFVYHTQGRHKILRYNINDGTVDQLLYNWSILNFSLDHPITHADIIGDLLYWTDNYNPPRKFNMVKAQAFEEAAVWEFTDNYYNFNYMGLGDKVGFSSNRVYNLSPGSKIFVVQNDGYEYDSYEGFASILTIVDQYHIVTDIDWAGSSPVNPGKIYLFRDNNQYFKITEQVLDRIKYPPTFPSTCSYDSDNSYLYNNLRGHLFQFRARFIYDDYEKSVWSPISKLPLPDFELTANGVFVFNVAVNNVINIWYPTGNTEVLMIEVAVREGNIGHWRIIDRVNKYDEDGMVVLKSNIYAITKFYNNTIVEGLDQDDTNRLFDYVPQLTACQAIVEKNRLMDANYVEGYDNLDIDVSLSVIDIQLNFFLDKIFCNVVKTTQPNFYFFTIYIPVPYELDTVISLIIKSTDIHGDNEQTHYLNEVITVAGDNFTPHSQNIVSQLETLGFGVYPPASIAGFHTIIITGIPTGHFIPFPDATAFPQEVEVFIYRITETGSSFKKGIWQEFGIVYYDRANRSGAVNSSDSCRIKTLFFTEPSSPDIPPQNASNIKQGITGFHIKWQIDHKPPSWATHYQWVRSNNTPFFLQTFVTVLGRDNFGNMKLQINEELLNTKEANKRFNIPVWTWEEGDRIRFMTKRSAGQDHYFEDYVDMEISGQELADPDTEEEGYFVVPTFSALYGNEIIAEFYRPRKSLADEESRIFYEFGEVFRIGNPCTDERYHMMGNDDGSGWAQDQTALLPAKGIFMKGDVYLKYRVLQSCAFGVEAIQYSDYYNSSVNDIGRPNIISRDMKRVRRIANLRFGGRYFQNTRTNDVSSFDYEDFDSLSETYGPINKIIEMGYTLKVLQSQKNTSIYIGREGLQQASFEGRDVVATSGAVIGAIIPSETNYGTRHPESVYKHERHLYFFDVTNGKIIRDAPNGMFPISNYKIQNWTRNMAQTLRESSSVTRVHTVYNERFDELMMSFQVLDTEGYCQSTDTIVFHEPSNRWKYFYPLKDSYDCGPQIMTCLGQAFLSASREGLWLHDQNEIYNNFYGIQHVSKVKVVGNIEPGKVKVHKALVIDSNKKTWEAPNAGDIEIPENATYERGMQSLIKVTDFTAKEGVLYASLKRNMLTNGVIPSLDDLINGNELRGNWITIDLQSNSTSKVVLFSVTINSTPAEKSG